MALDLFDFFVNYPTGAKLIGDDYMFVEYKCPIDSEKFKLWTDTPFLSYVISGKKDWTSVDATYTIKAGEALFFKRGLYNTKQYFEEDFCTIVFFLTEDFIRRFIRENEGLLSQMSDQTPGSHIYRIDVTDSLKALILSVFSYLNQVNIPRELVEMKFNELLYNIALNPANRELLAYFRSLRRVEKSNLSEIMNKNFHYDLKLEEYARLSGRSLSTFKRDFTNYFGETPGKWLNHKRLEYSRTLLQNPDLNISDICFESGFRNTSHFNSSFKKRFKHPPNQYRKQHFGI
ncbi:MAG: helix-turn-helix transcriptional regulator [Flavobacteriaceae bacterium]|jgi:AraC-like DNA-binding protein|nr:MAG: helix-turn-helix transcriptional regulator [Flavobacteriaceae bacterium]